MTRLRWNSQEREVEAELNENERSEKHETKQKNIKPIRSVEEWIVPSSSVSLQVKNEEGENIVTYLCPTDGNVYSIRRSKAGCLYAHGSLNPAHAQELGRGAALFGMSPDGTKITVAGQYSTIQLYETKDVEEEAKIEKESGERESVRKVEDGNGKKRSTPIASRIAYCSSHTNDICRVLFSNSGHRFVSVSLDCKAMIWDTQTGERLHRLGGTNGHRHYVTAVAISPNEELVATGDKLGVIKLWSMKTGKCVCTLIGHTEKINYLSFDNTSTYLFSSDSMAKGFVFRAFMNTELSFLMGLHHEVGKNSAVYRSFRRNSIFDSNVIGIIRKFRGPLVAYPVKQLPSNVKAVLYHPQTDSLMLLRTGEMEQYSFEDLIDCKDREVKADRSDVYKSGHLSRMKPGADVL